MPHTWLDRVSGLLIGKLSRRIRTVFLFLDWRGAGRVDVDEAIG
jgi:hypothetical protein